MLFQFQIRLDLEQVLIRTVVQGSNFGCETVNTYSELDSEMEHVYNSIPIPNPSLTIIGLTNLNGDNENYHGIVS